MILVLSYLAFSGFCLADSFETESNNDPRMALVDQFADTMHQQMSESFFGAINSRSDANTHLNLDPSSEKWIQYETILLSSWAPEILAITIAEANHASDNMEFGVIETQDQILKIKTKLTEAWFKILNDPVMPWNQRSDRVRRRDQQLQTHLPVASIHKPLSLFRFVAGIAIGVAMTLPALGIAIYRLMRLQL